jgi:Spy/CpxP family protein refolding chaperone
VIPESADSLITLGSRVIQDPPHERLNSKRIESDLRDQSEYIHLRRTNVKIIWKKFSVVAAVGAALLLMTAIVVFSQGPQGPPRGGGFHGPHDGLGPFGRELNLTDDQKAAIKKIMDSFEASTKALHEQLRTLHESEPDPMNGKFDEAAVRAAAEACAKIQVELEVSHAKIMSQIATVLTAEQKAQLAARHEQMRRMGPPPPPGPPDSQRE